MGFSPEIAKQVSELEDQVKKFSNYYDELESKSSALKISRRASFTLQYVLWISGISTLLLTMLLLLSESNSKLLEDAVENFLGLVVYNKSLVIYKLVVLLLASALSALFFLSGSLISRYRRLNKVLDKQKSVIFEVTRYFDMTLASTLNLARKLSDTTIGSAAQSQSVLVGLQTEKPLTRNIMLLLYAVNIIYPIGSIFNIVYCFFRRDKKELATQLHPLLIVSSAWLLIILWIVGINDF